MKAESIDKPHVTGFSSKGLRVDLERAKELLIERGYRLFPPRNRHEIWRAYNEYSNAVAFRSGKLIAQGRYPHKVLEIIAPLIAEAGGQDAELIRVHEGSVSHQVF